MRSVAKMLVKKPLNALGMDIVRVRPEAPRRFRPSEATEFLWLSSLNINTIIDIGAHIGEFAMMIHKILPSAAILSFEPLKEPVRQLEINMKNVSNFKVFNCALGDTNTKKDMRRNGFTPSSSFLQMAELHKETFPFTMQEANEPVQVMRLDDVVRDLYLEDNILIKIDVQGYEDRVISGGMNLILRAKLLIIETSFQMLYQGQPLFDEVYYLLRDKGFKYMGNLDQLRSPADGSVLQADAIFVKQ
jgi:FkbM family methyltransferase